MARAAADRVLPWRRQPSAPASDLAPLLEVFRRRDPRANIWLIPRAFETADRAHRDQVRRSGEAYIHHPIAVATIVAEFIRDDVTVAAALLHDAVEDTLVTV